MSYIDDSEESRQIIASELAKYLEYIDYYRGTIYLGTTQGDEVCDLLGDLCDHIPYVEIMVEDDYVSVKIPNSINDTDLDELHNLIKESITEK